MPTVAEALSTVPFFALLDEQERATLAERLDTVSFKAGEIIFRRGDPGDRLFVVRTGEVEIFITNDTGERIVVETAREGDFFGEISLLDGGPRTASAETIHDLDAITVDREDLDAFLQLRPAAAMDLLTAAGRRMRESMRLLRNTASRNVNVEQEDRRTKVMKVADWISEFSGSLEFLFIHIGLFFIWIMGNVGPIGAHFAWDPFPFGLLTMVVSLEAIILSVFVLLSQNRQVARDRVRNDIEYDVNVRAELEVAQVLNKVDHLHEEVLKRLERIERGRAAESGPQKT